MFDQASNDDHWLGFGCVFRYTASKRARTIQDQDITNVTNSIRVFKRAKEFTTSHTVPFLSKDDTRNWKCRELHAH